VWLVIESSFLASLAEREENNYIDFYFHLLSGVTKLLGRCLLRLTLLLVEESDCCCMARLLIAGMYVYQEVMGALMFREMNYVESIVAISPRADVQFDSCTQHRNYVA
jgi:hypothetical protein